MHEVGHAIFDSESSGASLDFERQEEDADFSEQRSQAFALETLIPVEVLRHVAQSHGIRWEAIQAHHLARLVADTGVEQKTIVAAAEESELIDTDLAVSYCSMDIASMVRTLTDRALSTQEYIQKAGPSEAGKWLRKRMTTIPSRKLRLPSAWIGAVLQACSDGEISKGKAQNT